MVHKASLLPRRHHHVQKARLVFTDPPYNVPIDGHVSDSGKVKH
jgi:16S rRNA G966 N2-methylase RsmD